MDIRKICVIDVEEGEISCSAPRNITEKVDIQRYDGRDSSYRQSLRPGYGYRPGVWAVKDVYYSGRTSNYATGLHNLAWAQAVKNKPLDDVFVMLNKDDKPKSKRSEAVTAADERENRNNIARRQRDAVENVTQSRTAMEVKPFTFSVSDDKEEGELEEGEIGSDEESVETTEGIEGGLIIPGSPESDKSETVHELNLSPETLGRLTVTEVENSFQGIPAGVQNALDDVDERGASPLKMVEHAFKEMNPEEKLKNESALSRLLTVTAIPEEQAVHPQINALDVKDFPYEDMSGSDMSIESMSDDETSQTNCGNSVLCEQKNKGLLVDLHKVHDADTLPSPTREKVMPGDVSVADSLTSSTAGIPPPHPYETDALEAFSNYQQKFVRSSILIDDLPSPTPSEDGPEHDDGETGGDVSSSHNPSPFELTPKGSLKSRDPRLRDAVLDEPHMKRQRTEEAIPLIDPVKEAIVPTPSPSLSLSLPDVLKELAMNPAFLMKLLQIGVHQTVPPPTETQPSKIQMKARDPRRVLGEAAVVETAAAETVSTRAQGDWEPLLDGFDAEQKAAIQRERARRIGEQRRMFGSRKLSLVLDLDHTLLNSAKFGEVDAVHDVILRAKEEQDRASPKRHLYRFVHMAMWTKLRPGVWRFLARASELYELHLYTMGNRLYATEMAKALDPDGSLFGGRVISRGDDGDPFDGEDRVPKTKDLDGVLGMESSVLIIDDSVRVWPHNRPNLILVERYTYFPCSRRQFGLVGPSLLEIGHDERPEDGTLASSLAVIERVHRIFFSNPRLEEVDVRNILGAEQQKILEGCRILFSRVIPVGEVHPHLHPLWQTAEQFGASCTNQIDDRVTHVVANSLGTDKVNWAISTGRHVVHPGWVEASALLYRRGNEHDFRIKPI